MNQPAGVATPAPDWRAVRSQFPSLANWTYLNSATFGQLPQRTMDAVAAHYQRRVDLACSDFLTWFGDADALRGSIARLIHCQGDDIAFLPNACTALGLFLNGIEWRAGDRIVTLENEFPNNVYHPALLASRGVEFVQTSWDGFEAALKPGARLVLLSEVNYSNGFRPPMAELARMARQAGALLFVDGTQSLGALRVDLREFEPDGYAVHGYKWLLCPPGAAFLYVKPEVREWLAPPVIGWRSHRTWRDVCELHSGSPEFAPEAERYEGGVLSFAALYGMQASVELMLELGPAAIETRVLELAEILRGRLRQLGARVLADQAPELFRTPIVCARFEGHSVEAIAGDLAKQRIVLSARLGNLRISPHFYNNEEDIDRLAVALGKLLAR